MAEVDTGGVSAYNAWVRWGAVASAQLGVLAVMEGIAGRGVASITGVFAGCSSCLRASPCFLKRRMLLQGTRWTVGPNRVFALGVVKSF